MRPSKFSQFLGLCGGAALLVMHLSAQAVDQTPPNLQKLDEGSSNDVTIRQPNKKTRTIEKRKQGVVTDVEVHTGKSTYHLKQDAGAGNAMSGDAQSTHLHPAQFQIHEFDLFGKKETKVVESAATADVPPPPPVKK